MLGTLAAGLSLLMLGALYAAFVYAPPERVMGDAQRIMYFHVATAWIGLLSFFVLFVSSIVYLKRRDRNWDRVAQVSGELGVLFTGLALISGSVWGRAVWGSWWEWEPRLTTTLLLWFIYVAYLLIRSATDGEERRGRLAAVFGIIGFVDVPIVYFSIYWWQGLHPQRVEMAPEMRAALLVALAAFTLFFLFLLAHRLRLERLRDEVADLKRRLRTRHEEGV